VPLKDPARSLSLLSIFVGALLAAGLLAAWVVFDSQLALAQAADSLVDTLTAAGLWWAVRISRAPPDEDHPVGHHAAEPLGALLVAVFAGALAVQVSSSAIDALQTGAKPRLDPILAAAFAAKVVAKIFISRTAFAYDRKSSSPALRAIGVDSRNDVLVGCMALLGFVAARYGNPNIDAWLALPLAVWIGVSAVLLGMENVRLLMGEAAPAKRRAELEALANQVDGVRRAHSLRAHHRGSGIMVWVQVAVDPSLTVDRGHDIGEAVESLLSKEPDVIDAFAHVDIE
jgi:cation diffusion facilitator family transporter